MTSSRTNKLSRRKDWVPKKMAKYGDSIAAHDLDGRNRGGDENLICHLWEGLATTFDPSSRGKEQGASGGGYI